jgi:hypothetical protein
MSVSSLSPEHNLIAIKIPRYWTTLCTLRQISLCRRLEELDLDFTMWPRLDQDGTMALFSNRETWLGIRRLTLVAGLPVATMVTSAMTSLDEIDLEGRPVSREDSVEEQWQLWLNTIQDRSSKSLIRFRVRGETSFQWSDLSWLLKRHELVEVHIEAGVRPIFNNAVVASMAESWPCLETLHLTSKPGAGTAAPTLWCLAPIARLCRKLDKLTITLLAQYPEREFDIPDFRHPDCHRHPLRELAVVDSPSSSASKVAAGISGVFPFLEEFHASGLRTEDWTSFWQLYPDYVRVRADERSRSK